MKKSNVKGVHFCSRQLIFAGCSNPVGYVLRGNSMEEAEKARLEYDAGRKRGKPTRSYKPKEKFNAWQPLWPASQI